MIQFYAGLLLLIFYIVYYIQAVEISPAYSGSSFHNNQITARGDDTALFAIDLMRNIQLAKDTEEVFSLAENIPAIRNSFDKALQIRSATLCDAEIAITAIIKFSTLYSSAYPVGSDTDNEDNVFRAADGRRLEQLTECVELRLSELATEQLTAYLTCLAALGSNNDNDCTEEALRSVLNEFIARADLCISGRSSLSVAQVIDMVHSATVASQLCGLDEETLVRRLLHVLIDIAVMHAPEETDPRSMLSDCSAEQLTRLLWSMAVHRISEEMILSPALAVVSSQFDGLSGGDGITLLWSFCRLGIVDCVLVSRTVNCISRYLEEAERLDQSGTLSHEDCLHLSESIEFLFRKFSSDLISYGDCNAEQQLLITDTLSSLADLSFLFMKTFLRRTTSGGDAWPTFTYISILKALSPVPVQPSWQQIAVDALSSMHAILSSAVASRYLSVAECCAFLEACAYEIASDKLSVGELLRRDGHWHRLVGRIAVQIGQAITIGHNNNDDDDDDDINNSNNILERVAPHIEALASSMFALATMGHDCPRIISGKVLMKIVSRPQDLDVLSAMGQCQLTISISQINDSEVMNYIDVAELLAGRTLSAVLAVDSVDIQAASIVAVSKILRYSKFSESYGPLASRLVLPGRWISSASTVMLMELHTAAARLLPLHVLSDDTLQAVRKELLQRNFSILSDTDDMNWRSCFWKPRPVRWGDLIQLAIPPPPPASSSHSQSRSSQSAMIAERACDAMLAHCQRSQRPSTGALLATARAFSSGRRHSPELISMITEHLSGHQNCSISAIPPAPTSLPEPDSELDSESPPPLSSSTACSSIEEVVDCNVNMDYEQEFQEGMLAGHLDLQRLIGGERGQSKILSSGLKIGRQIFSTFRRWTKTNR